MPPERDDEEENLDLTEDLNEADDPDGEDQDGEADGDGDDPDGDNDGEEETVIAFEDEAEGEEPEQGGNIVIRTLRAELKERNRRIRELEQSAPAEKSIEVGEKPTLASCNYDEEAYETSLDEWRERKTEAEQAQAAQREQAEAANAAWQNDLGSYREKQAKLGVSDFEEAEEAIKGSLSMIQQAVIVKAASDPAALVYALSRSPAKLAELAKMQDPIKMAAAVAKMEGSVTVVKRRKGPAIDRPASGSGKTPTSGDKAKKLEALEAKAAKSGDRTEVIAFKRANPDL